MEYIEKTLLVIKPDGVQRTLVGDVINRMEKVGLKIVGMKMLKVNEEFVEKHYLVDPNWKQVTGEKSFASYKQKGIDSPFKDTLEAGESILNTLKKYITSGPVVAIVLEGAHAVALTRKLVGSTEPLTSDVGTIRGDYVMDSYEVADISKRSIKNIVHASGNLEEAKKEIAIWFDSGELVDYKTVHEDILYGN